MPTFRGSWNIDRPKQCTIIREIPETYHTFASSFSSPSIWAWFHFDFLLGRTREICRNLFLGDIPETSFHQVNGTSSDFNGLAANKTAWPQSVEVGNVLAVGLLVFLLVCQCVCLFVCFGKRYMGDKGSGFLVVFGLFFCATQLWIIFGWI